MNEKPTGNSSPAQLEGREGPPKATQCLSWPSSFDRDLLWQQFSPHNIPLSIMTLLLSLTHKPTMWNVVRSKNNVSYYTMTPPKKSILLKPMPLSLPNCVCPNPGAAAPRKSSSVPPFCCCDGGSPSHWEKRTAFHTVSCHYTIPISLNVHKRIFLTGQSCRISSFLYGIVRYCLQNNPVYCKPSPPWVLLGQFAAHCSRWVV